MRGQRHESRLARLVAPVHTVASQADVLRLVEHLVAQKRTPDCIERLLAAWLREHHLSPRADEVRSLIRQVAPRGHARSVVERIDSLRRRPMHQHARVMPTPIQRPARDAMYFAGLRAKLTASDLALAATGFVPERATSSRPIEIHHHVSWGPGHGTMIDRTATSIAPTMRPGVYVLQMDSADVLAAGAEPDVHDVLRRLGQGRPLARDVKARLAPKLAAEGFTLDLDAVVVHEDAAADTLCREMRANAFCIGRHVAFRAGRFRPDTRDGEALLAHELIHVWQQARLDFHGSGVVRDAMLEAEAHTTGARVACCHEGLVSDARALMTNQHTRPAALFVVSDRIRAYDRHARAVASWAITGERPRGPGTWFDAGADVERWSTLTHTRAEAIAGGRADTLWMFSSETTKEVP